MTERAWSKLASSINTVRYVKRKKKTTKNKKTKTVLLLFPPPQGFPKLFINNWFPSCISGKTAGNRRDGTKQLSWTLLGLRHGRFCIFQCFKIWPDCLNFKHWPILSSANGALLIFTVKSTLNYTRVLRQSTTTTTTKKKNQSIIPRSDAVVCDIWSGRTRFGN